MRFYNVSRKNCTTKYTTARNRATWYKSLWKPSSLWKNWIKKHYAAKVRYLITAFSENIDYVQMMFYLVRITTRIWIHFNVLILLGDVLRHILN